MARYLVTGGAGFIGSHLAEALKARGDEVRVFDCFDPYYDPAIKRATAKELTAQGIEVVEGDLRDLDDVQAAVEGVDGVVNLAARPGVRASIEDPHTTFAINVTGFLNLLEAMRGAGLKRLVFASSSSVYGGDAVAPFREAQPASRPLSPYAASKRANELQAATYVELFGMGAIGLRFFTVYGPRGRPDMAIGKFLMRAYKGESIPLFGDGSVIRDFTYVEDIVRGVVAALDRTTPGEFHVSNIGGGATHSMRELLAMIEEATGTKLEIEQLPAAAGDMPLTHADLEQASTLLGFESRVPLKDGLARTAEWTRSALGLA